MKKSTNINQQKGSTLTDAMYLLILECLENASLKKLKLLISMLHPADCADLIEKVDYCKRSQIMPLVKVEDLGLVLANLNDSIKLYFLQELDIKIIAKALYELETDDIANVLEVLKPDLQDEILKLIDDIDPDERMQVKHTRDILDLPENSAGRMMKSEVITVPKSWSVQKIMDFTVAESVNLPEKMTTIFVVNRKNELIGSASMQRLVRNKKTAIIKDIMRKTPIWVNIQTEQKDVLKIFEKYNVLSCAVLDNDSKLIGQITVDDVLNLAIKQSKEDILHMAGVSDDYDLFLPAYKTVFKRIPWLFINLLTAILASFVIALFESQIQQVVALAVLMPIIASMGGNAGTQTLAVIIRGLATDQITVKNAYSLLRKEVLVGSFNGLILGLILAGGTYWFYNNTGLALVIFVASIVNHVVSAFGGHGLPILLKKLGKDPAISSGIFLTTLTDVVGFFVFLGLASLILL